jgi:VWFA-related protein
VAAGGQGHSPGHQETAGAPYFERVTVRLVLLQATVLNRRGETIRGLTPADFQVLENGVPQTISVFGTSLNQPLKIAFLLDISGSMALAGRLEEAKKVIRAFVEALRPEDQVALLVFADGDVVVEIEFTTDRLRFHEAVARQEAFGRTALRDALAYAPRLLAEAKPGRKALIMLTDGVDNASEITTFRALRLARQVQVPVYTVGMTGLPEGRRVRVRPSHGGRTFLEVMQEFSSETGGKLFPVFDAEDVARAVATVKGHLQGQYVIGYHPEGTGEDPGFREVDLLTADPAHQVQTRRGYYVRN